jgi:hypothetical protein
LCEPETAAYAFSSIGIGNAPLGRSPMGNGSVTLAGVLARCNALGFRDLFWPQVALPPGVAPVPSQACGPASAPMPLLPPHPLPGSVRGAYLLAPSHDGVTLRWRSAAPEPSVVSYGASPDKLNMTLSADDADESALLTEHAVRLTGLSPATRYYYAVGAAARPDGGRGGSYFTTLPRAGQNATSLRFWVHGDFGEMTQGIPLANASYDSGRQAAVLASWLAFEARTGKPADAWLALGDIAYNTGSDQLMQFNFFDVYGPSLLRRTPVWPVIGNHDAYSWLFAPSPEESGYGLAFGGGLPGGGEALCGGPGVASGTWRYYSFNVGRVHVVALDSMTLRSNNSFTWNATAGARYPDAPLPQFVRTVWHALGQPAQALWLAADLAAVAAAPGAIDWVIAMYHHPAYSDGSHKSDSEVEMVEMRTLYNPILEAGGVDIAFHGHSHAYERMLPTTGFVGAASSYKAAAMAAKLSVNANGVAVHHKPAGVTPRSGTTYVVAGSGGQLAFGPPPSFVSRAKSLNITVSCALDVHAANNSLALTCLHGVTGAVVDAFIIQKAARSASSAPAAATKAKERRAAGAFRVGAALALSGVSASSFGQGTPVREAFIDALAAALGVSPADVAVTAVTDGAPAGAPAPASAPSVRLRRLLADSAAVVTFTVAAPSAGADSKLVKAIDALAHDKHAAVAFVESLNERMGTLRDAPTVTGIVLATPPVVVVAAAAAPAPAPGI